VRETYLGNGILSIDVPSDPRSVAMAESFVAIQKNCSAMFYNPAGLAGTERISVSYSRRAMNWLSDDMRYESVLASVPTNLFDIGFSYNRFAQGELRVISPENPEGDGTTVRIYDHTFAIGIAKTFDNHLSLGLSIKTFNAILSYAGPSSASVGHSVETNTLPLLFDLGALYNNTLGEEGEITRHLWSVGFSVQNVGTTLKQTNSRRNPLNGTPATEEYVTSFPQYLRLGFSYGFVLANTDAVGLTPLNLLVTFDYRNAINNKAQKKSYLGFGFEAVLYEIAAIRLGAFINPYSSIYGGEGSAQLRYGVGLCAPLQKLDIGMPLSLTVDYAAIPLNNVDQLLGRVRLFHTFSVGLQYEGNILN
jgi:hypothetical protein